MPQDAAIMIVSDNNCGQGDNNNFQIISKPPINPIQVHIRSIDDSYDISTTPVYPNRIDDDGVAYYNFDKAFSVSGLRTIVVDSGDSDFVTTQPEQKSFQIFPKNDYSTSSIGVTPDEFNFDSDKTDCVSCRIATLLEEAGKGELEETAIAVAGKNIISLLPKELALQLFNGKAFDQKIFQAAYTKTLNKIAGDEASFAGKLNISEISGAIAEETIIELINSSYGEGTSASVWLEWATHQAFAINQAREAAALGPQAAAYSLLLSETSITLDAIISDYNCIKDSAYSRKQALQSIAGGMEMAQNLRNKAALSSDGKIKEHLNTAADNLLKGLKSTAAEGLEIPDIGCIIDKLMDAKAYKENMDYTSMYSCLRDAENLANNLDSNEINFISISHVKYNDVRSELVNNIDFSTISF